MYLRAHTPLRGDEEASPHCFCAFTHGLEAKRAPLELDSYLWIKSASVVAHSDFGPSILGSKNYPDVSGIGVLPHIGQGLLDDPN